jgi:MoaA/NifB/PqqE/SkfB family radical SAM enzyme
VRPDQLGGLDLAGYHEQRDVRHQSFRAACYAPFVGMSFDMNGVVSVCAFTRTTPIGQVGQDSLLDMWRGPTVRALRRAVERDDLTHACTRCAEEIAGGNLSGSLAAGFDRFTAAPDPLWPTRMEFALSNACNLQCVMCSGEFSSSIRAHREGMPPLPQRYGDEFLEELTPFLPHLDQARFLGGEPFLAEINFRIWERLIQLGLRVECNVTTNGTQWSPRVERVLEALPFSIGISVDGVRPETVESIRAGVDHERLMRNVRRFVAYRDRTGASLSLTYCLMVQNLAEFVDFLLVAEELGCSVFVNTVRHPPENSPYLLGAEELAEVVTMLEAQRAVASSRLNRNRGVLDGQIERLRSQLADLRSGDPGPPAVLRRSARAVELLEGLVDPSLSEVDLIGALRACSVDNRVDVVRADDEDRVAIGDRYVELDLTDWVGRPASALHAELADRVGHRLDLLASTARDGTVGRVMSFTAPDRSPTVVALLVRRGPAPWTTSRFAAVVERGEPPATAVQLR